LPWTPAGVTISLNPEIGRQWAKFTGAVDFTYWDVGLIFNYKAATLDLRYWDTTARNSAAFVNAAGNQTAGRTFVATLKFDTTWSSLK
jgi:hypothetical protein